MSNGFVAPGDTVQEELHALTYQAYILSTITRGRYVLDEKDLPDAHSELLHGRAYVIDRKEITETSSASSKAYYIAADKVQGLIVPARTLFIKSELGDSYYRWTDDGEKWTDWITLIDGLAHTYLPQELCRFAEVQVYAESSGALITLRATR